MSEEFNFRKGDIVKQRNTSVLDIYGEVIVADSYQRNHMIVDFGKSRGQIEVPKSRFEVVFRRWKKCFIWKFWNRFREYISENKSERIKS